MATLGGGLCPAVDIGLPQGPGNDDKITSTALYESVGTVSEVVESMCVAGSISHTNQIFLTDSCSGSVCIF